jgi:hypothetical protein
MKRKAMPTQTGAALLRLRGGEVYGFCGEVYGFSCSISLSRGRTSPRASLFAVFSKAWGSWFCFPKVSQV